MCEAVFAVPCLLVVVWLFGLVVLLGCSGSVLVFLLVAESWFSGPPFWLLLWLLVLLGCGLSLVWAFLCRGFSVLRFALLVASLG